MKASTLIWLSLVGASWAKHHRHQGHDSAKARREREFGRRLQVSVSAVATNSTSISTTSSTPPPSPVHLTQTHFAIEANTRSTKVAATTTATGSSSRRVELGPAEIKVAGVDEQTEASSVHTATSIGIASVTSTATTALTTSSSSSTKPIIPVISIPSTFSPGTVHVGGPALQVSSSSSSKTSSSDADMPDIELPTLPTLAITSTSSAAALLPMLSAISTTGLTQSASLAALGGVVSVPDIIPEIPLVTVSSSPAVPSAGSSTGHTATALLGGLLSRVSASAAFSGVSLITAPATTIPDPSTISQTSITSESSSFRVADVPSSSPSSTPALSMSTALFSTTPAISTLSTSSLLTPMPTPTPSVTYKKTSSEAGNAAFQASVQSIYGSVQSSTLLIAPTTTSTSIATATSSAASGSSSIIAGPASLPAKIVPPTDAQPSSDDSLASIMLSNALSYQWLLDNTDAASQIFAYMPSLIAGALDIPDSEVQNVAIVPYESVDGTFAVWTGYVPTSDMSALQALVSDPDSALYTSGTGVAGQLAGQLNSALPVGAYDGSAPGGSLSFASSSGGSGNNANSAPHTTLVAVTSSFGAVVVLLGTFVTWRARTLRQKSTNQSGPVHLDDSDEMRDARLSTISTVSDASTLSSHGSTRDYEFDWANLGHDTARRNTSSARRIRSGRVSISRPTLQGNSLMM